MPGFDQTGPEGQGPMTGRKTGRCTNWAPEKETSGNNPEANIRESNPGRGFGLRRFLRVRGRGPGRSAGAGRGRSGGRQGNQNY